MWEIERFVSKGDYTYAVSPNHPNRSRNRYVLAHRIVVENHLGRLLSSNEVVHHKDGNKKNNDIDNLEVMNYQDHIRKHVRKHGTKMVELLCPCCGTVFYRRRGNTFLCNSRGLYTHCSRECRATRTQDYGHPSYYLIREYVYNKFYFTCHVLSPSLLSLNYKS